MGPDQTNALGALDWSRSIRILIQRTQLKGKWTGYGATRSRSLHKRGLDPVPFILSRPFSLFTLLSSLFSLLTPARLWTLTLTHSNQPRNSWFMAQKLHLVVLITNPLLEFTCISWNDVDLEISFADFEWFWFCSWFKSFLNDFACGFVDLQRLLFVVNLWIFHVFWKIRVSWFWTKTFRILYGFTSV